MKYPKNRNYTNLILDGAHIKVQVVRPYHYSVINNDSKSTIRRLTFHKLKRNLWQVYFWDPVSKKQIFLQRGTNGKALRKQDDCIPVLGILVSKGFDPKIWNKDKSYHFDVALENWISLSTCSQEWLEQRKQIGNRFFIPFFKQRDIRTIKTMDINQFVAGLKKLKKLSDKSLYNVVGELKAFFNFHKRSLTAFPDFPRIRYQLPQIRSIGRDDQDRIFKFIPRGDLPIFTTLRFYGCRENEASGLLWENVILNAPKPYLVIATALGHKGHVKPTTKSKKPRVLPITKNLRWIFENECSSRFAFTRNGRPYSNKMLNYTWKRANLLANEKYGVPIINLRNATRHSFACQRLNEGFPMHKVKTVLGHSDPRTTERYGEYSTEALEDIIEGEIVNTKLIPHNKIQPIETTKESWLGGEDSNLGSKIQSLASCR